MRYGTWISTKGQGIPSTRMFPQRCGCSECCDPKGGILLGILWNLHFFQWNLYIYMHIYISQFSPIAEVPHRFLYAPRPVHASLVAAPIRCWTQSVGHLGLWSKSPKGDGNQKNDWNQYCCNHHQPPKWKLLLWPSYQNPTLQWSGAASSVWVKGIKFENPWCYLMCPHNLS